MDLNSKIGIVLGVLLGLGVSAVGLFVPYAWPKVSHRAGRAGVGLGIVIILASVVWLILIPSDQKPEVTLRFVNPQTPELQLVNGSKAVANDVKYMTVAWNLDLLNQRRDPLPIPATPFGFLTSENTSLPISIFQTPLVAPLIKQGDRIFGSAAVSCPTCTRGRTFWFYLIWGEGGWYSEDTKITNGNFESPKDERYIEETANQIIGGIPVSARIPISVAP